VDAVNGTEYVPTYKDTDGDWMLVGDVPWKFQRNELAWMFNELESWWMVVCRTLAVYLFVYSDS